VVGKNANCRWHKITIALKTEIEQRIATLHFDPSMKSFKLSAVTRGQPKQIMVMKRTDRQIGQKDRLMDSFILHSVKFKRTIYIWPFEA
jgi:hypothetical protein